MSGQAERIDTTDAGAAAERFEMAAERAPRWGLLHMRWAAALWATGDRKQAMSKLSAAGGMDLNDADRRRLRAMLRAASAA